MARLSISIVEKRGDVAYKRSVGVNVRNAIPEKHGEIISKSQRQTPFGVLLLPYRAWNIGGFAEGGARYTLSLTNDHSPPPEHLIMYVYEAITE